MHGRSCMAIDPRAPTWPGLSTLGFHRPGQHIEGGASGQKPTPPTSEVFNRLPGGGRGELQGRRMEAVNRRGATIDRERIRTPRLRYTARFTSPEIPRLSEVAVSDDAVSQPLHTTHDTRHTRDLPHLNIAGGGVQYLPIHIHPPKAARRMPNPRRTATRQTHKLQAPLPPHYAPSVPHTLAKLSRAF